MIIDHLQNAERYFLLNKGFVKAFQYLKQTDLRDVGGDRIVIDRDRIFAIPVRAEESDPHESRLEAHNKYIDIQYVVDGTERIGWKYREECEKVKSPFNSERDVALYSDEADTWISIVPGMFAILFPEDAHFPISGPQGSYKILVKVEVDYDEAK